MLGPVTSLDDPMWSLVHEIRISVLFPLLLLAVLTCPLAYTRTHTLIAVGVAKALPGLRNPQFSNGASTLLYLSRLRREPR